MTTQLHNANGHRRRELRKRVLAEEHTCALCDTPVDKTLTYTPGEHGPNCPGGSNKPGTRGANKPGAACRGCRPHPMRPEIDEDIPRSRGGSPYDRNNCRLMHRRCNQWKSAMTLAEARAKYTAEQTSNKQHIIKASNIW